MPAASQEARAREAAALARAQSDAKIELERTQVEIKVKDKVLEQQQREIQALKVRTAQLSGAVAHTGDLVPAFLFRSCALYDN